MCEKLRQLAEKVGTFTLFGIGKDRVIQNLENYLEKTTKQSLAREARNRTITRDTEEYGHQEFSTFEDYIKFMDKDKKEKEERQNDLPNFASNEDFLKYEEERKRREKEQITLPNGLTVIRPQEQTKKPSRLNQQSQTSQVKRKINALREAEVAEIRKLPPQEPPLWSKEGYKKAVEVEGTSQTLSEAARLQKRKDLDREGKPKV